MKKIFLLCLFTAFMQNLEAQITTNWKIFENSDYSIQYPTEWKLNDNGYMGTSFFIFSPFESSEDTFTENVNLMIQDLSEHTINLDKFVEISEEQIKTLISNSNLLESRRIKNNTTEYHYVIFTGNQENLHLKFLQYYILYKKKAYILTLTCEEDTFEDYKTLGISILNSFKLK